MLNKILIFIIFKIFSSVLICCCYPVNVNKHQKGLLVPAPEIVKFMKRFGYLDSSSTTSKINDIDSDALYHENAIIDAIKNIQKFGALNQTGILDEETLKLMKSPRCGVADIDTKKSRSKRYVIGSQRWRKHILTYFISNWSPKIGEEKVVNHMTKAFRTWAPYCNLRFKRIYDSSADIIVGFGSGYHGDNYPFDGPGNVLAHAFYPYEMQSYGGDIHFDNDENWKENSTKLSEGVDFYSVAVHELGHSLGLSHSPVYSSIMFPYYKGAGQYNLDYDDILAMYELYIKVPLKNEDLPRFSTTKRQRIEETTFSPTYSHEGDYETVYSHKRTVKTTTKFPITIPTVQTSSEIPNICEGNFDAVATLREEVYIFKGEYVWKITKEYQIAPGYPIKIINLFPFLQDFTRTIDAIYERFTDHAIIIFYERYYWIYDGYNLLEGAPRLITDFGIHGNVTKINAAMFWPKNQRTYLFSTTQIWRYNDKTRLMDIGYPKNMRRWVGIPEDIDAATSIPSGKTYFFKGNLYWLYNDKHIRPEIGYPRIASNVWLGCPLE